MFSTKQQEAIKIATQELRLCYTNEGILAGTHHFTDYWARDGYFAALGSLAIGDQSIVENMLKLFYKHQRSDGLIPYRIMRGPITLNKYLGHPSYYYYPRPTYRLRGLGREVLDGTTLTLLFTAILGLKNFPIFRKYLPQIQLSLDYLKSHEKNGLLLDGVMAEWNDTALKWGNLLYSNIIYWYMYDQLMSCSQYLNNSLYKRLEDKKHKIALSIRDKLWTGRYFADWYDYKRQDYFYSFGNCLAIAWGLTTQTESDSILSECKKYIINFTLETNFPKYPRWRIDPFQRLAGMGDYQNKSLLWWQPITSYLAALKKTGKQKDIKQATELIINKIITDKSIFECYERTGFPLKRLFYSAEHPFAWSSGTIIWALTLK
jgi:glycogen debranching enzyme